MKSKILLAALLGVFFIPPAALAEDCPKALYALIGPFFSPAFVEKTFKTTHQNISSYTGCDFEYHISENYDQYHQRIKEQDYDIILIPSMQLRYIEPWGYKHIASGLGPLDLLLLGRKNQGIFKLEDLIGKRVLLNGDISTLAVTWRSIAEDKIDIAQVNIRYTANSDQMLMRLLRGEAEATVTFNTFYNQLPKSLQNNLSVLGTRNMQSPASIITHQRLGSHLTQKIQQAYLEDDIWSKQRATEDFKADAFADTRLKQVFDTSKQ